MVLYAPLADYIKEKATGTLMIKGKLPLDPREHLLRQIVKINR
jgi:hypothetical protein